MSYKTFYNENGKLVHYMYAKDVAAREVDVYTVEEDTNINHFICTVSFDAKTDQEFMFLMNQLMIDMDNGYNIQDVTKVETQTHTLN